MSKIALIGKKLGMTNLFIDNQSVPVTLIEVLPNDVIEVRKSINHKEAILQRRALLVVVLLKNLHLAII